MKKITTILLSAILVCLLCFSSCAGNMTEATTEAPEAESNEATSAAAPDGVWADAEYTEDTVFGEGEKTITVEVTAEDKTVTFTVNTDKAILGDALIENKLVEGEQGAYGLYIKKVNGITADYSVNGAYWSFMINGEMAATGVDGAEITDGGIYQLVYTK